ncbi:MAG TPA: O-antigen ligase family protein [Polyangiaceae bacterium]
MARRIALILVWLALVPEVEGQIFDGKWETPLTAIGTEIFKPSAIKITLWDLAVLVVLVWALLQKGALRGRVRAVITSMWVSLAALGLSWTWGVVRGGDIRQTLWQLHTFVMMFAIAHLLIATCRTYEHFRTLGRVIVGAALYRAGVLLYFYETVVKSWAERPQTLTTHADSALFVAAILILGAWALERRSQRAIAWALGASVPICLAIYYNNRRLAWLSLLVGMAVAYLLLPNSKTKRQLNRAMLVAAPLFAIYCWMGWGKTSGIFKPVASIATMLGKKEDASSLTRDIENYNLIETLKSNPLLGLGFGHEYHEVSVAYSIKEEFEQYRFIPHNSVLGLWAFGGVVGFAGIWQVFVVSTYFLAREHRLADLALARAAALAGVVGSIVVALQMWGDMGLVTLPVEVLAAACIAAAARLPALGEEWSASQEDEDDEEELVDAPE